MTFGFGLRILTGVLWLGLSHHGFCQKEQRILVFTKTRGYAHASIPDGIMAVRKIAETHAWHIDTTSNVESFNAGKLSKYAALVFISTNGAILNEEQREKFRKYIQSGGGFLGVHGASAGARSWPWYVKLVGALFVNHPEPKEGVLLRSNDDNAASVHFPDRMIWKDEWYNFTDIQEDIHVLLSVDESSYIGGEHGRKHPIAWYHEFEGGRSFYTGLGHFSYHFTDALFLHHLEEGLKYVMRLDL